MSVNFRYLIEFSYLGNNYSGFQKQPNASSIEEELEKALSTFYNQKIDITGSSRTDSGVHALSNFAHFDLNLSISHNNIYNLNAILPKDISIKNIFKVPHDFHSRFDAKSRNYIYNINFFKNPLTLDTSYFFPYTFNYSLLEKSMDIIKKQNNFESFSKKHTDVFTYFCKILECKWTINEEMKTLKFEIKGDRFLRGMVRALVATQLAIARGYWSIDKLIDLFDNPEIGKALFNTPPHGLTLTSVNYDDTLFESI